MPLLPDTGCLDCISCVPPCFGGYLNANADRGRSRTMPICFLLLELRNTAVAVRSLERRPGEVLLLSFPKHEKFHVFNDLVTSTCFRKYSKCSKCKHTVVLHQKMMMWIMCFQAMSLYFCRDLLSVSHWGMMRSSSKLRSELKEFWDSGKGFLERLAVNICL